MNQIDAIEVPNSWAVVALWVLLLMGLAGMVGWYLARSLAPRRHQAQPGSAPPPAPEPAQPGLGPARHVAHAEVVSDNLVAGLIGAHDLAGTNDAVRKHVEQVLRRTGVSVITADTGTAFDPAEHDAVDTEPAGTAHFPGTVARVVRPGWAHGSTLVRAAEVVVWTR